MLNAIITYGLLLLHYSLFFIAVKTTHESDGGHLRQILSGKAEAGILFNRMIAGVFFLGIGTAFVVTRINFNNDVFAFPVNKPGWIWIGLGIIAIIFGSVAGIKENSIHFSHSLPSYLPLSYLALRTLFLVIYEFFFRGAMLFLTVRDFGVAAAITINLILYILAHWYDRKERIGSIITGLIFCFLALHYQSVWPAVIVHVALSLAYETTLLTRYHSSTKKIRL